MKSPADSTPASTVKVVYIGGYSRSGTTLLTRLLGRAPNAVAVGELTELWERSYLANQLCGCGVPFLECEFWGQVSEETFGCPSAEVPADTLQALRKQAQGHHRIPQLAYPRLSNIRHREALVEYRQLLGRLYTSIGKVSGAGWVVDSSKVPQYAWVLAGTPDVETHLVHLVRDSRAAAFSWQRHKMRTEIHWENQEMARYSVLRSSLEWDVFNYALHARRHATASYTVLRYEDLASDPQGCLVSLADAIGLDLGPAADLDGSVDLPLSHTTAGNPSRFDTGTTTIHPDEAWRAHMPRGRRAVVTALTAPGLRRYRYPLRSTTASAPGSTRNADSS